MIDSVIGLLLLGLGLTSPVPGAVLGNTAASGTLASVSGKDSTARSKLRVLQPVLTKEQEDAFRQARKKREEKIAAVSEKREATLKESFAQKLQARKERDAQIRAATRTRIQAFTDRKKQERVALIATKYEDLGAGAVTAMQEKLTAMLTLLDKISVAAAALAEQGKDVSAVDSDITAAQAKITTALTLAETTAEAIPATISFTNESTVRDDIQTGIADLKVRLSALHTAFTDARQAVGKALTDLKAHTQPVDVTSQEAAP